MKQWLCMGGPLHGRYAAAGQAELLTKAPPVRYSSQSADGTVITGQAPISWIKYVPQRIKMSGFLFSFTVYMSEHVAKGYDRLEAGITVPGGILGGGKQAEKVCRWCFGQPIRTLIADNSLDTCDRISCITNVAWLHSLQVAVASDAEGWHDDV